MGYGYQHNIGNKRNKNIIHVELLFLVQTDLWMDLSGTLIKYSLS